MSFMNLLFPRTLPLHVSRLGPERDSRERRRAGIARGDARPVLPHGARRTPLLGVLHRPHPQSQHTPRLPRGPCDASPSGASSEASPSTRSSPWWSRPTSNCSPGSCRRASVKQHLAALRMLFDWLVVGQVLPFNPASSVRGPKHVVKTGKTPILSAKETRALLDGIEVSTLAGLRDRAFLGVLVYSFARVSAAVALRVADYYTRAHARSSVSTRRAGGTTSSPPTTQLRNTSTPTSPPPASARTDADRCSEAASPGGTMRSRTGPCHG